MIGRVTGLVAAAVTQRFVQGRPASLPTALAASVAVGAVAGIATYKLLRSGDTDEGAE